MRKLDCVLIVEDDPVSSFIAENAISGLGIAETVITSSNGRKALEYIMHECSLEGDTYLCPDLIVLDINMPHMGGIAFLEKFRKMPTNKKPVIVIHHTVEPTEEQEKKLKELDIKDFIMKPMTGAKLQAVFDKYFGKIVEM
ncbi:MAG TPA: response regulator [Cytophagaceae bacterium]